MDVTIEKIYYFFAVGGIALTFSLWAVTSIVTRVIRDELLPIADKLEKHGERIAKLEVRSTFND